MKKAIGLMIVVIFALSLVACGPNLEPGDEGEVRAIFLERFEDGGTINVHIIDESNDELYDEEMPVILNQQTQQGFLQYGLEEGMEFTLVYSVNDFGNLVAQDIITDND